MRHYFLLTIGKVSKTFPIVFYRSLNDLFPHERDYILIDAAGESTDVSEIRNGVIEHSYTFSHGKNELIRNFMKNLNVGEEIAKSYLHLSESQNANQDTMSHVDSVIAKDSLLWESALKSIFEQISLNGVVPNTCFFVCDDIASTLFNKRIMSVGLSYGIKKAIMLNASTTKDKVAYGKFAIADHFISLEAFGLKNYDITNGS